MYIKQRKRSILIFALFSFIFLSTFFVYNLPIKAVIYPVSICTVLGLIFLFYDIVKVKKKHDKLSEISRMSAELMEHLPKIQSQDDEDYQAIISALRSQQRQLRTDMTRHYQDMIDYYTIWAHQIKTPIAAMRLTLQNEDSELSRQLTEELQRIEQYVEMVLAFLRLDSVSKDYVFKETELDKVIKEAGRKFAGQCIRKKLKHSYSPIQEKVLTDEKWLCFVIEQVLSNAVKYTKEGGSISIEYKEPMTLCIKDTGIGIAPEDLPRVFEKSYTGYNGRSDKKASGIGLYLCRRICDNLGHRISVNSSLDNGTTVSICMQHEKIQVE